MKKGFVIAIDGPVASGKGTITEKLASTIDALNFNSGGVYRAYALKLKRLGIDSLDGHLRQSLLTPGEVSIKILNEGSKFDILLGNEKVTELLATPEISKAASDFGRNKSFFEFVSDELRRIAKEYEKTGKGIIMEGRQIGTDVFPDADIKIFLTADLDVRARRRFAQYQAKGIKKTFAEVLEETEKRDMQDTNREFGALPKYPEKSGYVIIDNSNLNEEQTLEAILVLLQKKGIWKKN